MTIVEEIKVGTAENAGRVRDRLSLEFGFLAQQGFDVSIEEVKKGDVTFFICRLVAPSAVHDESGLRVMFRHYMANALSDLIVNDWERNLLRQLLEAQYADFEPAEQRVILASASRSLDCRTDGRPDLFRRVERKGKVLRLILDYLNTEQEINLDGFVIFRLQEYREQLGEAVGKAVDEFLMEKEYLEFINLLRYFLESQEPKLKLVHVIIEPKGAFRLMDEKGATVTKEYLAESFLEVEGEVNSDDLLVSALITLAPERIILHCPTPGDLERREALDTIRHVFEGRITVCRGCEVCRQPGRSAGPTRLESDSASRHASRSRRAKPPSPS